MLDVAAAIQCNSAKSTGHESIPARASSRRRKGAHVTLDPNIAPAPARRGTILVPGLPVLLPNVERHPGARRRHAHRDPRSRRRGHGDRSRGATALRARGIRRRGTLRPRPHRRTRGGSASRHAGDSRLRNPRRPANACCALDARMRLRAGGRGAAVRRRVAGRNVGVVRRDRLGDARRQRPRRPDAGLRAVRTDRDRALCPPRVAHERKAGARTAAAARGAFARPQHPAGSGSGLRGQGGSTRPDRRREGTRVHRLPGIQPAGSRPRHRARDRSHHDPYPDGLALSRTGAVLEVLHRRSRAAARARPGHVRAPRLVRSRLHRALLRGHGISGTRELLGQHQCRGRAIRHTAARWVAGHQLLLQHHAR